MKLLSVQLLSQFDMFFTGIFTLELFLKLVTYGLVLHPGAFLRSAFNVLDMLVVCVSLISMSFKLVLNITYSLLSCLKYYSWVTPNTLIL